MDSHPAMTRDAAIAQDVQTALKGDPLTAPYPIEVSMQGTTATISGTVDSPQVKNRAEEIARSVNGVVVVINELMIDEDKDKGWFGFGKKRHRDTGVDQT